MDDVKRYYPGLNHSEFLGMKEHSRGGYVTYEDHKKIVEELQDEIKELQFSLEAERDVSGD